MGGLIEGSLGAWAIGGGGRGWLHPSLPLPAHICGSAGSKLPVVLRSTAWLTPRPPSPHLQRHHFLFLAVHLHLGTLAGLQAMKARGHECKPPLAARQPWR